MADHGADLVLVDVLLDGRDQGHGEAGLGAVVQRLLLDCPQVASPDRQVRFRLEAVELQVDVDPPAGTVPSAELGHEPLVGGEPDAVGVEVDRVDRSLLGQVDHRQDVLVDGGLTA